MMIPRRRQAGFAGNDLCSVALIAAAFLSLIGTGLGQTSAPPHQIGTVMEVKDHQPTAQEDSTKRYDISIKVGHILYVVLYTPQHGSEAAEYKTGLDFPVQVDGKMLRFTDALGRPVAVPIVSQTQLAGDKQTAKPE